MCLSKFKRKETLHHRIRFLPDVSARNYCFPQGRPHLHSSEIFPLTILLLPVKTAVMHSLHPSRTVVCRPQEPGRPIHGAFCLHSLSFLSAASRKSMVGGGGSAGLRQAL